MVYYPNITVDLISSTQSCISQPLTENHTSLKLPAIMLKKLTDNPVHAISMLD